MNSKRSAYLYAHRGSVAAEYLLVVAALCTALLAPIGGGDPVAVSLARTMSLFWQSTARLVAIL
jgi:hypothetical protein